MEELVPRPDPGSFAARQEKRRAVGARMHGDPGADGLDAPDSTLMGSSGMSDFKRAAASRAAMQDRRAARKNERLSAAGAKEAAKMAQFKAMMGLK